MPQFNPSSYSTISLCLDHLVVTEKKFVRLRVEKNYKFPFQNSCHWEKKFICLDHWQALPSRNRCHREKSLSALIIGRLFRHVTVAKGKSLSVLELKKNYNSLFRNCCHREKSLPAFIAGNLFRHVTVATKKKKFVGHPRLTVR